MYKVLDQMDVAGQTQQKMTIFTSIISGNLDYVREMTEYWPFITPKSSSFLFYCILFFRCDCSPF